MIELYPQGGLMVMHSDKSSDKDLESTTERILPSQIELISIEELSTSVHELLDLKHVSS